MYGIGLQTGWSTVQLGIYGKYQLDFRCKDPYGVGMFCASQGSCLTFDIPLYRVELLPGVFF